MCELGYKTTSAEMTQRLKSISSDPRYGSFVAEIDNEIRGMIGTLTHASPEYIDPSGKIIALVVSKKERRSCVGRTLIAAAEKDVGSRNVRRLTQTQTFRAEEADQ